ncbi:MAG: hypothetical protein IKV18_03025, partial [Alistipes sp.]|nr:hypothetical protein [Alistipes sp.]
MRKKFLSFIIVAGLFSALSARAQKVEAVDGKELKLKNYHSSWIGNEGGYEEVHIPHDMWNMYVNRNGVVATICDWDEGGTNVAVFKDGKLISRPEGSGTGGWGRFSGQAVVLDDKYVYQLLTQHGCDGGNDHLNDNGLPQYPPCRDDIEWKTIRRYDIQTGLNAPFKGGYGYKGDMTIVCKERNRKMTGLAIHNGNLFVAVTGDESKNMPDSVKIYDTATMSYLGGYQVKGGVGQIYADNKDGLWMIQGNRIVRMNAMNGKLLPQAIDIPDGVVALSLTIDTENNRLLLPNRGKDMNVLIYTNIYKRPTLSSTFGSKGGIFAQNDQFKAGQVGEYRFSGPTAAGVDTNGNIYVANTAVSNGRGAVVEAYNEKTKRRLWKSEGLIFTATADFDRTQPNIFYSPEKIHRIDFSREGGRIDELVAYTADPFRYPDDERVKKNGAFVTSSFKRTIGGKSFLFISDMYGGMLAGYRFDEENYGYIAVPFLFAHNGDPDKNRKITFWVDDNGDAVRQQSEFHNIDEINQYSMSMFIDHAGNIWRGTRHQGFFLWRCIGLNSLGIPQYAEAEFFPLPESFGDAKRIYYDPATDNLYLGGFSPAYPDGQDTWWALGSTIVRCGRFLERVAAGEIEKGWKADMILYVPFGIEDGSGRDYHNAKSFAAEGDYIFVALGRYGFIMVYEAETGKLVGRIEPDETINNQSGWCDFNYAINVMKQEDGSYLILHEENAFGKILCYHWYPDKK